MMRHRVIARHVIKAHRKRGVTEEVETWRKRTEKRMEKGAQVRKGKERDGALRG
jgi:hypothetical protein